MRLCGGMIRSYYELYFDEQYSEKRAIDSRSEYHGTVAMGLPYITSESHGGDSIIQWYDSAIGELHCSSAYIRLREPGKLEDKAESFHSSEGSMRVNKDKHNIANPTPKLVIGELKQHDGSEFDYSTTAVESGWEQRGMLPLKHKIGDSTEGNEM
ncbi:hypothetical protein B296_00032380 [Ensete ventricosum]|uniref:Uncharacterized protein n=1 Tax=Ensete ventricosum TaxID=4639 RepID=A0A427ADX6_ENSVE|nr:hypothetical protein B296_00032380 [Ensete ventricosum]